MRRFVVLGVLFALVLVVAVPAIAGGGPETRHRTFVATLSGDGQTTPNESTAAGLAQVTIDKSKGLICYDVLATGVTPTAIHIHEGAPGVDGPVVVDFSAFGQAISDDTAGCTLDVGKPLLKAIKDDPKAYYVNLHSVTYPGGELRGNMARIR